MWIPPAEQWTRRWAEPIVEIGRAVSDDGDREGEGGDGLAVLANQVGKEVGVADEFEGTAAASDVGASNVEGGSGEDSVEAGVPLGEVGLEGPVAFVERADDQGFVEGEEQETDAGTEDAGEGNGRKLRRQQES